jgi:hypothetical protein
VSHFNETERKDRKDARAIASAPEAVAEVEVKGAARTTPDRVDPVTREQDRVPGQTRRAAPGGNKGGDAFPQPRGGSLRTPGLNVAAASTPKAARTPYDLGSNPRAGLSLALMARVFFQLRSAR